MNQPFTPPSDVPLDKVLNLRSQGFSDPQIVEALQREGYRTDQVYNAINQGDLKGNVEQAPPQAEPAPMPMTAPAQETAGQHEPIEEIAEAIIEEKWKELTKQLDKIQEWKDGAETQMNDIQRTFDQMKKDFENLHTAVLGKVSEYDQNIVNLGAEIKAMEKVFQKLLPTFTDNVTELSRITDKLKKK